MSEAAKGPNAIGRAVHVDRISKHYGSLVAVDGVSLHVEAGEFVSLLGPSGSGKTTLLMMIAGFERPDSGTLMIGGHDFTHVAPNRRGVGMVFQKYALFPHMTIRENIAFPLKMRKFSRQEVARRVQAALELVRLEGYGDRTPSQLSGGQQQRIAVARALVFEPPVLLMDEPLGALDKKLREQMQIEIKAIQERLGVTVIYVTHDQEEALTMSDRVAVMDKGHLVQVGTPIELYQAPASPFVADFIGKMNFIDAEFVGGDDTAVQVRVNEDTTIRLPHENNGATPSFRGGDRLRVAVRPEQIALAPAGKGGPSAISGQVMATIFVGAHQVFLVSVGKAAVEPLHVQVPTSDSSAFERGEAVDLVLKQGAFAVFEASAQ
ncbi:MAG: ABC transporter ATP-binding protein [Kiloniellales bacterium]|nr:ABC transporter ATP-binding protein [Kiloniellales bacterium]